MLRVLTYHRVSEAGRRPHLDPRLISASPAAFKEQAAHLARNYRVLPVQEVLQAVRQGKTLPRRSVLITFDDAYRDFGEIAWPILRRYRLPATLFVPTAYPGNRRLCFWWDRLYRALQHMPQTKLDLAQGSFPLRGERSRQQSWKRLRNLIKSLPHHEAQDLLETICRRSDAPDDCDNQVHSWEELGQLASDGVALGAHTRTHPVLTQIPASRLRGEILGSQQDLKAQIGSVLPIFSYPDGGHDERIVQMLADEGFEMAFTTQERWNAPQRGRTLRLGRTNITPRTTPSIFRLRLWPPMVYLDAWRHGHWGMAR